MNAEDVEDTGTQAPELANGERAIRVFRVNPRPIQTNDRAPGLRADRLTYRYPQHERMLGPISLSVERGECLLLTGPSGCGKSTLARCCSGLIPHLYHGTLDGSAWIDGLPTADTPLWRLAERAGLVFQNPAAQMLAPSVEDEIVFGLENLGLDRPAIRERLEAALARFGLQALRGRAPQTLSGGEQQRLALAAITARRPPVLVLDEPLSMLDGAAAADLVRYLDDLAREGTALLVCEHRAGYLAGVAGLRTLRLNGGTSAGAAPPLHPMPYPGGPAEARLEVSGLGVQRERRSVLRGLDLALAGGQVTAVLGRNGVGKTTLLRALAGLQKHTGRVGVRRGPGPSEPADLGLVFQNADLQLFNASVRAEVLYRVPEPDLALYAWLIDALGLAAYADTPPLLLSEGEKKRVALATVLMRRPRDGVLLDEPALGQDSAHKDTLVGVARALAGSGRIVVIATHDLDLALQADRVLLLGPQGFVADGPPGQVMCDPAPWRALGLPLPGPHTAPAPAQPAEVMR